MNLNTCARRYVTCALYDKEGNVLAYGNNGPLHGPCNCPGRDIPAGSGGKVACYAIHAEVKALMRCYDTGAISLVHRCVTNKAPCRACVLILLGTPCQEIEFSIPSNETENRELWERDGRKWIQAS